MSKEKIGLKLANGEFYPVLEDGEAARKRLVVTTVQDGQRSVQIDLYRGSGGTVAGAKYIGSLVVEGIPPMPKGEPDIRMDIGLGADETLTAYAEEASTGASQRLEVSLKSLTDEEKYEIPDFEFSKEEEKADTESSFSDEDFEGTDEIPSGEASLLAPADEVDKREERRAARKPLLIALFCLAVLLAVLGIAYVVYTLVASPKESPAVAERPAATTPVQPAAPAPAAVPAPAPAPAAPPKAAAPAAPKPAAAAKEPGVWHTIRWGDTLWDLAYAYYRNPWYYPRIAKANKIKNPDLIISGHKIWIPKL
jgi:pyruvate/2-oxoglutarate dehydrogenase complex dihydrolipoamide acyltransferase (E2) component